MFKLKKQMSDTCGDSNEQEHKTNRLMIMQRFSEKLAVLAYNQTIRSSICTFWIKQIDKKKHATYKF